MGHGWRFRTAIALLLYRFVQGNYNRTNEKAFTNSWMRIAPNRIRTPVEIVFDFTVDTNATVWDAITIDMPQFTTSNCDGTAGYNIKLGHVKLHPSLYFEAEWREGSFDYGTGPFANSSLVVYFKTLIFSNMTMQAGWQLTILAENNIKAYCGYQDNWEKLKISTNTTGFGTNATYHAGFIVDRLGSGCDDILHNCSGHGQCNYCYQKCDCEEGWGGPTDVIGDYTAIDCSARTCPLGRSWMSLPTSSSQAHTFAECANNGICDRMTGTCRCFAGFTGDHCQRRKCPNDCRGRGQCMTMQELAVTAEALPLGPNTEYGTYDMMNTTSWDFESLSGCVCDSSWDVGLGAGQVQEPEFFGPDCSMRHCPSGDDPETPWDETDCSNKTAPGGRARGAVGNSSVGLPGNLCHVDCSNRGICDFATGKCKCFNHYYGDNCGKRYPIQYTNYAYSYRA